MKSGGLASGPAEATSEWGAGLASPQVLILAVAALAASLVCYALSILLSPPLRRWVAPQNST